MAVKTTFDAKIDTSMLQKHLQDYSRLMGKEMGAVIQNQAALFCKDMCKYTPAFDGKSPGTGLSSGAKKEEQQIVAHQIRSIFKPLDKANPSQVASLGSEEVYRKWITFHKSESVDTYFRSNKRHFSWKVFQNNFAESAGGHRIITSMSDMEQTHFGLRYKGYGGLKKSVSGTQNKWRSSQFCFIVEKPKLIDQYVKRKVDNVGYQKSGYFYSAKGIGDKTATFPAWVKHSAAEKQAIAKNELSNSVTPSVTVGNQIGLVVSAQYQRALDARAKNMRKQMVAFMKSKKITLCDAILAGKIYGTAPLFSE